MNACRNLNQVETDQVLGVSPADTTGETAAYTWLIVRNVVPYALSNIVFRKGPSGAPGRAHLSDAICEGAHFRLLDPDGKPRLWGYIAGDFSGREPLEDYGAYCGCVSIEYQRDDAWVASWPTEAEKK